MKQKQNMDQSLGVDFTSSEYINLGRAKNSLLHIRISFKYCHSCIIFYIFMLRIFPCKQLCDATNYTSDYIFYRNTLHVSERRKNLLEGCARRYKLQTADETYKRDHYENRQTRTLVSIAIGNRNFVETH